MRTMPRRNRPTLVERVQETIVKEHLIPPGSGVLVAVSGGPDSMALLDLLRRLQLCPLRVAHLNHCLRPGDADLDEMLVRQYCQQHQLALAVEAVDVAALAAQTGLGLEAAGREARYRFFHDCIQRWQQEPGAPATVRIALAHHLDDQAETILLHLGRGCGLDGLIGMKPQNGQMIRPLLNIRRMELRDYLKANEVPWRQDATNEDLLALRNRLRHQVLPHWHDALGYDPATLLSRGADLVRDDLNFLEQQTDQAWLRVAGEHAAHVASPHWTSPVVQGQPVSLDLKAFRRELAAMQNRLLRRAWRLASGQTRDIEWRHVQIARDFLNDPRRKRGHLDWPLGVSIDLVAGQVILTPCVAP